MRFIAQNKFSRKRLFDILDARRGFVALYLVDAGGGVMISTSVFQDQSGAEESNKRAADYVRQNLAPLLPKPPQITAGKVVAYKAK
jgi:hypothetical protein